MCMAYTHPCVWLTPVHPSIHPFMRQPSGRTVQVKYLDVEQFAVKKAKYDDEGFRKAVAGDGDAGAAWDDQAQPEVKKKEEAAAAATADSGTAASGDGGGGGGGAGGAGATQPVNVAAASAAAAMAMGMPAPAAASPGDPELDAAWNPPPPANMPKAAAPVATDSGSLAAMIARVMQQRGGQ